MLLDHFSYLLQADGGATTTVPLENIQLPVPKKPHSAEQYQPKLPQKTVAALMKVR
jgi:hypothetical protein